MMLSGDINGTSLTHGYIEGLLNRFGNDDGQRIIDYVNTKNNRGKYTCDELEKNRIGYNKRIKELLFEGGC